MTLEGYKSPKWGHLGVHFLCTGPDPAGPRPGQRLRVVIYNEEGEVVRRFEQEKGRCLDPGYVDFFMGPNCRPAVDEYHFVDIDSEGVKTVLATHTSSRDAVGWFKAGHFGAWAREHGVPR